MSIKSRRLFAILVITAMVLAMLPASAFAATYSPSATLLETNKTSTPAGQYITFTLTMRNSLAQLLDSTTVQAITLVSDMDTLYGEFLGANAPQVDQNGDPVDPDEMGWIDAGELSDRSDGFAGTQYGPELVTDNNGQVKFKLTSAVSGSTTVYVYTSDSTHQRLLVGSAAITFTAGTGKAASLNITDAEDIADGIMVNNEIELVANVTTTAGNPVSGAEVTFQERKAPNGTWTTIGTKATSAVGTAKFKYSRTGSGKYHYRITVPNISQSNITYPDDGYAEVLWKPGAPVKMTGTADLVGAVDKPQHIDFYLEDVFGNKAYPDANDWDDLDIDVKVTAPSDSAVDGDATASSPAFGDENFGRYRVENWTPDVEGSYTLKGYIVGTGISFTSKVVVGQFGEVAKIDIIGADGVNSLRSAAKTGGDPDATYFNLMVRVYDSAGARYTIVSGNNADSDIAISSSHPQYATVTQGGQVKIVADQAANRGKTTITAVHIPTGQTATYDFYVSGAPAAIQEDVSVEGLTANVTMTMVDADGNVARRFEDDETKDAYASTPYTVHVNGAAVSNKTNFSKYTAKGSFTLTAEDYGTVTVTAVADNGLAKTFDVTFGAPKPEVVGAKSLTLFIGSKGYVADGAGATSDAAPFIQDGRTFVPVRLIAEAFGAEADWTPKDAAVEVVTLTRDDIQITINIGAYTIDVVRDGVAETIPTDVAAFIKDGRTFLPFRVIAEAFGAEVDWGPKDGPTEWVTFTQ